MQLDPIPYTHIITHIKTTLELPDDLLREAKTLAIRRNTTLRALVESALRREIRPAASMENPVSDKFEMGPFGILSLKRNGRTIPRKKVRQLVDQQFDQEDARTIAIATGNA